MKMTSSHPDRDNPRGDAAVASSAENATTQPNKKGVPGKGEHRSPSLVDDPTDGVMRAAERKGAEERIRLQARLLDAAGRPSSLPMSRARPSTGTGLQRRSTAGLKRR
jgi:hypothetical protein